MHIIVINLLTLFPLTAAIEPVKEKTQYRDYSHAPDHVKKFYRENHINQTVDFVKRKKAEYGTLSKAQMTLWQAIALLDTIKDESDPDLVDRPQSYHAYQTAEALRKAGKPDWLVFTGFIHDLGKILTHFGEPQWAVVGDTFPVGCAFSNKIIFHDFFSGNKDFNNPFYNCENGIYTPGCGLDNITMSWGHDEYLYMVLKDQSTLPPEALFIIRYHSFYAAHREGAYQHLMNENDKQMVDWLKLFSSYDLYSKEMKAPDVDSIKSYYEDLVEKFAPGTLDW